MLSELKGRWCAWWVALRSPTLRHFFSTRAAKGGVGWVSVALPTASRPGRPYFNKAFAVVNAGRISFGTAFIFSSAFCTSGRMTTYLVIMSFARA
jgi:hypothetical protein